MTPKDQQDLAKVEHWDSLYETHRPQAVNFNDYNDFIVEYFLSQAIERDKPKSILEIGCGNSYWLPHFARKYNVSVAGIDYSEIGCESARKNLEYNNVAGHIFCSDIFDRSAEEIGKFDLVFSLGVVEHFTDLQQVLERHLIFLNMGGTLFILIPNLLSIQGFLLWLWNPSLYAKHRIVTRKKLEKAFKNLEISIKSSEYGGFFSFGIVQWENQVRWPKLVWLAKNIIYRLNGKMTPFLLKRSIVKGIGLLAPYIVISGTKKR